MKRTTFRGALWLALGALASEGCVGAPAGASIQSAALEQAPVSEWIAAPAGCASSVDQASDLRSAASSDGLLALVDEDGKVLCVDAAEAVSADLKDLAASSAKAQALSSRLEQVVSARGDPSPQPSRPSSEINPHPVPSSEINPHPVPSSEINPHPVPSSEINPHPVPSSEINPHPVPSSEINPHPVPSVSAVAAAQSYAR